MKKKMYLIVPIVVILIALISIMLFLKNKNSNSISYIPVTTKFYTKSITNTTWNYQYTDKYNENTHEWDFRNTDIYTLRNGKWKIIKTNEPESNDNVASIKLEKKSKGAYYVIVEGHPAPTKKGNGMWDFNDKFIVDCATSKVTELIK